MSAVFFTPGPALRPYIRRFVIVDHARPCADAHLPELGALMAFRLSGTCLLHGAQAAPLVGVSGLSDQLRHHLHSSHNAVAVVAFTPAGAAALFQVSWEELFNRTAAVDDLAVPRRDWPADVHRLRAAGTPREQARELERLFGALLRGRPLDPLLVAATEWAGANVGARIDDLARFIGLSQSALERRFRRQIGVPPKQFAMLARFQRAVRLRESGLDLTATAHAAGYADQAHFTNDCKRITGNAPSRFFGPN